MVSPKDLKFRLIGILFIITLSIFYIFPLGEKINLGLDLKGGMYLVLKVDTSKVDPDKVDDATEVALEIIRNRIDEFGVKEPTIQVQGNNSILVQLPGEVDRDRAIKLIGQTAFLEFKMVEDDSQKLAQAAEGNVPEGYEYITYEEKPILLTKASPVSGADVATAQSSFDSNMFPLVSLQFNSEGAKKFAEVTSKHVGKRLAIVLDGVVKSAPVIREAITAGQAQITGDFTVQEAQDLALVLRAGALPAPLVIEEERTVGPLLGSDSIHRGVQSIVVGAGLVIVFMLIYYLLGGVVALACLVLDLLFVMAGLSFLKATLTLPGIAGMILTLGMAVDANVLIFERIREELREDRPLSVAVKNGFDRSKRTIFDANITTLIAALFLFRFGTGPIRGFATTLSLGIIASIFTAVFIGRTIFSVLLNSGIKRMAMLRVLKDPNVNFVKIKNICLIASLVLIVIGAVNFQSRGDDMYGIDFKGGQILQYQITPAPGIEDVRGVLEANIPQTVTLQSFKDIAGGVIIKSKEDITSAVEKTLNENFENVQRLSIDTIGPAVGEILRTKAILAVTLSLLGILIYIAFRFKHFDFAFAAVCAVFHDVLISMGFLALFGYEINLLTITALLTLAGYSVNDTIVVYDRIRELSPKLYKLPLPEIINRAINETLSRTIITSLTTIAVVLCIFVYGGEALRGFSFTLLVGFIVGTYSSIYIASPLVLFFRRARLH